MLFSLEFTGETPKLKSPQVIQSIEIEAEDLRAIVSRARVILSSRGYEPGIDAFRIVVDDKHVVYREQRGAAES